MTRIVTVVYIVGGKSMLPCKTYLSFCSRFLKVVQCAKLAGSFVEPASFCKLTLPHLKTVASSSSSACASCLKILAALIAGCNPQLLAPHLKVNQ